MSAQIKIAQIPGFPDYTFTQDGRVYKNGLPKCVSCKQGQSAKIVIRRNKKIHTFGFATLIANAFIPNPNQYPKIAFKDRNNHNCKLENIEWVSRTNWGSYSRAKNKEHKPKVTAVVLPKTPIVSGCEIKTIIGASKHHITSDGRVFRNGVLCKTYYGKCVKVKIQGRGLSLGKLVATHFIPNPKNFRFVIYKDRNNKNCTVDNILWASNSQYISYAMGDKIFRAPKKIILHKKTYKRKKKILRREEKPNVQGVRMLELTDYGLLGIYITSGGKVFYGSKQIDVRKRKNKAPQLIIQRNYKKYYFGFAKLIATHFVANPRHHKHIIFKDRNKQNCNSENLAWVDGETFLQYSMGTLWRRGAKKKVFNRQYAIKNCKDHDLKSYYASLDDLWLDACWQKIEKAYSKFFWWNSVRSECYVYFLDRAKRFSIVAPPRAMIWYYAKGQRIKLQNEISPDMPYNKLAKTDESLRGNKFTTFRPTSRHEEW